MAEDRADDTAGTYPPGMEERDMRMVEFIGSASVGALAAMLALPAGAQVATAPPPGQPGDQSTSTAPVGSTATGAVAAARDDQTAPAGTSTASPDNGTAIGDIVVTAQRREELLSRVGITVAAVGSQELQQRGINNPQDLVKLVPGFQATTTYGGNPVYTLRGIGFNTRNASSTSPVGIYQDEAGDRLSIHVARPAHDLERVEVLKGPQGTLYGRNATGGLVNYVSAKPTDTLQGGLNFEADPPRSTSGAS
ncbi:TonB-dependent receptor plug domain-containing protein [Sphingomonas sp. MMS24-JH45]